MKVFSLGGSVLTKNLARIGDYADAFDSLDEQVVVVTGAGELKKYIEATSANQVERDLIGIRATRLNAAALATEAEAHPRIPETVEELREALEHGKDVYMGGLAPGYSTDAVAAIAAELLEAELFIASDVEGVYDRDPEKSGDARLLDEVSLEELEELSTGESEAGRHPLIDATALEIMGRSELNVKFLKGSPENISDPGKSSGTVVRY